MLESHEELMFARFAQINVFGGLFLPTLREISEITGVSISTVSRVLKNDSRISEATKKKVLRIAKRLGYSGDIANGLGSKVVMFFVSNPHRSIESDEFFSGVQRGILRRGPGQSVYSLPGSVDQKQEELRRIADPPRSCRRLDRGRHPHA